MRQIWLIGTDHTSAGVSLRERLALHEADIRAWLPRLLAAGMQEAVVLSTCNRTEIYGVGDQQAAEHVTELLIAESGIPLAPRAGKEAVSHLMRVSAGLASMIIGEGQILAQIRQALAWAREQESVGPVLNALFEDAITAGKRVRSETPIATGVVSVGSAAVRLARQMFGPLDQRRLLVMGTGQMGEVTVKHLKNQGAGQVTVTNRSEERGRQVAAQLGAQWLSWQEARSLASGFDAVFVCTGAQEPVIDQQVLESWSVGREQPILLADLAMPRNVSPALRLDSRARLVDLDDLQATVNDHQAARLSAVSAAEAILREAEARFWTWLDARRVSTPLYAWAERVCAEELQRSLQRLGLDPEQQAGVLALTRGVAQKLLHKPVAAIWAEADDDLRRQKADQVAGLFGMDRSG